MATINDFESYFAYQILVWFNLPIKLQASHLTITLAKYIRILYETLTGILILSLLNIIPQLIVQGNRNL